MSKNDNTVTVIGAGAAGLLAAWRASALGARVTVLEKNPKPAIKILISGGGKCNITNASDFRTMLKQFATAEERFLRYSFHEFTNVQLLELLRNEGVETYARENGKVFPVSHDAEEVVNALMKMVQRNGVTVRLQTPVKEIFANPDGSYNVQTNRDIVRSRRVIVATGGASYQKTGTTGDGYRWLRSLGHSIVQPRPALAPIMLNPVPPAAWQGTPVRDGALLAVAEDTVTGAAETAAQWNGDLLITHFGLSGPAALEVSHHAFVAMEKGKRVTMVIDFFPERTADQMEEWLRTKIEEHPSRSLLTLTEQTVPQRLAEFILVTAGIPFITRLNQITRSQRRTLAMVLKRCPLGTVTGIPLDRGEVTAGGVSLSEIDPTTMGSKVRPGLFVCGELLDVAGPVGGYNLQAAFSTGYVAGTSAGTMISQAD
ncbi:MAG: aminoacetone oxidase family FAD-binding enzyme [Bacteroidetes bacterium]|nr:aminoacetone oxidase family FAD-binding enzyme [Bacteroidota bacterium]